MKLEELLNVIVNGEYVYIFLYDNELPLYVGENLEYNEKLQLLRNKTVLYVSKGKMGLDIGVK